MSLVQSFLCLQMTLSPIERVGFSQSRQLRRNPNVGGQRWWKNDGKFGIIDVISVCDRQTDGQTDRHLVGARVAR